MRAIYHGQGWRVNAERYVQLPSWLACLPMVPAGGLDADLARMGRMKTLLTSAAVNLAPVHGEWRGEARDPDNPPALFLIGRRGQPACWSPFANMAGNYNVAVTGKSGSGKSVLMQELVTGIVGAGGEAVVIDDGRSFQHTAEALGGSFIGLRQGSGVPQPLRHDRRRDRRARRRLPRGVLRDARGRRRADVPAQRKHRRHRGGADRRGHRARLERGRQRGRPRHGAQASRSERRPPRGRHGHRARPLVPGRRARAAVRRRRGARPRGAPSPSSSSRSSRAGATSRAWC